MSRIVRVGNITDFFHGRHEGAQTDVSCVRRYCSFLSVDVALLHQGYHAFKVTHKLFAPFWQAVGLGDEPAGVEDVAVGADVPVEGVLR